MCSGRGALILTARGHNLKRLLGGRRLEAERGGEGARDGVGVEELVVRNPEDLDGGRKGRMFISTKYIQSTYVCIYMYIYM